MGRNYRAKDLRVLFTQSGNLCAFPGCTSRLVESETPTDDAVNVNDIAHIVADSRQGPRGHVKMTEEARNHHSNLLLFCTKHHRIVDTQPRTYSVPVLQQIKKDHLARVAKLTGHVDVPAPDLIDETVHSSIMAVTHMPAFVYAAPCKFADDEAAVREAIVYPNDRQRLYPFILRDNHLFTFDNLCADTTAFKRSIDCLAASRIKSQQFWKDEEGHRRFVNLLNRTMHKYASLFGIWFDPKHVRYYYPVRVSGEQRTVRYTPLNQSATTRLVAWQPKKKSTGESRPYWWHLAAGLRFDRVGTKQWALSIRIERHITTDGQRPFDAERIGPKVTRLKARMYNDKYLSEMQFWRDVLSEGRPRFIIKVGTQSLICDSTLLTQQLRWPGVPDDEKDFRNQEYAEDLFSVAEFEAALRGDPLEDDDEDEDEEQ